jgi:hypothetical protein
MTSDQDPGRTEPVPPSLDNGDAARHVAYLTGMSPEAAEAFAAYHSGRFTQRSAFRGAA